ncbi:MAG: glycosyltransferase [Candidatus Schekmanbacteria bacterium]|nr:glycosyltransferase [Candidatus Schekmanbacteria bacterium]
MTEISIVIPTYNASFSIEDCLKAIYETTGVDFEVIIVDDLSTDNTIEIVKQFPCRLIKLEEKSGPSLARNIGAENAKSDIIMFVDSDAVVENGGIERLVSVFRKNPDIACVSGVFDVNPNKLSFFSRYRDRQVAYWHYSACDDVSIFILTAGAIRKDVFFEVGGFERKFGVKADIEDFEIGHRIVSRGHKMVVDKQIRFYHFEHSSRFTNLVKKLFKRTRLWMHLFWKRKKFEKNYVTAERSYAAIFAGLSFLFLVLAAISSIFLIPAVVSFILFVLLDAGFYRFLFKDGGLFFLIYALAVHYFLTIVICTGAFVGLSQALLGLEAQK